MSDTPRRQRILEAIKARLEGIKTELGFRTNLGDHVLLEEVVTLGGDDPESVLAILVGEEATVGQQREKLTIALPIEIHVLTNGEVSNAWFNVEAGIADVKQAIERVNDDRFLSGLASERMRRGGIVTRPRESGSNVVGAMVPYVVPYVEEWGYPER